MSKRDSDEEDEDKLADEIEREVNEERKLKFRPKKSAVVREKKPLRRAVKDPAPFPIHALGENLAGVARALANITRAPLEAAAMVLLAVVNMSVQGLADLLLPHGTKPITLFMLIVMASGERKTSLLNLALKPVREFESELWRDYEAAAAAAKKDPNVWLPPVPVTIITEATIDGLTKSAAGCRGPLLFSTDEAAVLVGGHSMGDKDRLRTCGTLNRFWDGSDDFGARAAVDCRVVRGKRVAICAMGQPSALAAFIASAQVQGIGLLGRFLIVAPASTIGTRLYEAPSEESVALMDEFNAYLGNVIRLPLPLKPGTDAELNPRPLKLTPKALRSYIVFYNKIERQSGERRKYFHIQEAAAKAAEQALRIAATLALFEDPEVSRLQSVWVDRGIELAQYFVDEALRISTSEGDPDLLLAEKTLAWIGRWADRKGRDVIGLTELYRNGPTALRKAERARKIAQILVDHGYLLPVEGGEEIEGEIREAFTIL